jgi:hypothetical protein
MNVQGVKSWDKQNKLNEDFEESVCFNFRTKQSHSEGRGSRFVWNVDNYVPMLHFKRLQSEHSSPREAQILYSNNADFKGKV